MEAVSPPGDLSIRRSFFFILMKLLRYLTLPLFLLGGALVAAPMTNDDVVKLVRAGLDDGIIITSIQNCEPNFDTSSDGLIALSEAKVSKAVVTAIIQRASGKAAPAAASGGAVAADGKAMSPSDVLLIDGESTTMLQYSKLQIRVAARGLGFGGAASYCVIHGTKAGTRVKNKQPEFLLCLPERAQPNGVAELVLFAVRRNGTREVMTGGGYGSYSTGFPPERVVAIKFERADQSNAPDGFVIYRAIPQRALAVGEYAIVVNSSEAVPSMAGPSAGSCFDFGVDP